MNLFELSIQMINNLKGTFQAYRKNYLIVTRKEFFSCDCDYLDSTEY